MLKTVFWRLVRTLARWVWSSAEQSGESSQGQEAVTTCRGEICLERLHLVRLEFKLLR